MTVSTIGEKTVIIGNIHGDGDLEVHGRVQGDVTVEGNVLVSASSEVRGSISAASIRVAGSVEGNLHATETVAVEPAAKVLGDMTTPRVSVAEGAVVRGMVRTDSEPAAAGRSATANLQPSAPRHNGRPAVTSPQPGAGAVRPEPPPRMPDAEPTPEEGKKKSKDRPKRPPEPKVPSLAKGTKGKKKGDKRAH